jgi:hypothetical protein
MLKIRFYRELCGKVIKPLFFKVPLAASRQHIFTLIPLLRDCAAIHRVAVFFYRKGSRGFAEGVKASRPLRSLCGKKHRHAVKKPSIYLVTLTLEEQ